LRSTFVKNYFWAARVLAAPYSALESAYSWRIMQEVACNGKTKGAWIASTQML
jgi:hypothetical protein